MNSIGFDSVEEPAFSDLNQNDKNRFEEISTFQNNLVKECLGEKKMNKLIERGVKFDIFTFRSNKNEIGLKSKLNEPLVCKNLMVLLRENPKKKLSDFIEHLTDSLEKEELGLGMKLQEEDKDKDEIYIAPQHKAQFHENPIEFQEFDEITGKIKTTIHQPQDYQLKIFTEQQYARMTTAALRGLNDLSKTLIAHNEKMNDNSENYPLRGRRIHQREGVNEFVKESVKDLQRQNIKIQRKQDYKQEELKQEKKFEEERDHIKRKKTEADVKYTQQVKRRIHSDELKALEKGDLSL